PGAPVDLDTELTCAIQGVVTCGGGMVFFSSRRRHTRSYGDWSSDVCSSDLIVTPTGGVGGVGFFGYGCLIADNVIAANGRPAVAAGINFGGTSNVFVRNKIGVGADGTTPLGNRSEERRVGKEGQDGGWRRRE